MMNDEKAKILERVRKLLRLPMTCARCTAPISGSGVYCGPCLAAHGHEAVKPFATASGAWQSTYCKNANGGPLDKQEAQRRVFQLRRKALNSAKTEAPVNKCNHWPGQERCDVCGMGKPEVRRGGLYCTHHEALASGFYPDCEQTVNLLPVAEPCVACRHKAFLHTKSGECMEWKCACERFETESPEVAEKSPEVAEKSPDECSICRGRHGSEVTHACE